jgi:hypothetical protein
MPGNRRVQRSIRVTLSVVLLAVAALVVLGALATWGALWLALAATIAWVIGVAVARILGNELRESRLQHARDRAEQAQAYAGLASRRATENAAFAAAMKQKVADHAANVDRLKATLRLAERRAELAEQAADRNKVAVLRAQREIAELLAKIAALEAERSGEMSDGLAEVDAKGTDRDRRDLRAVGPADDVPTVVDMLAALEDRAAQQQGDRRRA